MGIIAIPKHGIKPSDIDISRHLFDAFGNAETEDSAHWIVRLCQQRDDMWKIITYEEIETFYSDAGMIGLFSFNKLFSMECLYEVSCDAFAIDFRFVARCYVSSLG